MAGAKHTSGPWTVEAIENTDGNKMDTWLVYGPYRSVVAQPQHRPHNFADAHLIAAAPEMYAALQQCPLPSSTGSIEGHYQKFYDWYRAYLVPAIAKAEAA